MMGTYNMVRAAFFALAFSAFLAPSLLPAQCAKKPPAKVEHDAEYFNAFPYSKKLLTRQELIDMDDADPRYRLTAIRATIFGRHGRVFRDPEIMEYLRVTDWYKPNPKFSNSMLNDIERANLDLVREREAALHSRLLPGDLRFYRERTIASGFLKEASLTELHIMRAEIEAIHGKRFDDEPLLQKYFNERYWYKPAARYDPKSLNDTERSNLAMLAKAESAMRGTALTPGSMLAYGDKLIDKRLLRGLNLHELRLLRNEIYAVRGGTFKTEWIQSYFDEEDWYEPLPKGQKPALTHTDELNVATILARENELHQALSLKKLGEADVKGMMADDIGLLKNEIFARRGKSFKSKWIQGYFASLPWYKANPAYSDKLLNPVERENIRLLAKWEKKQAHEQSMEEG